MKTRLLSAALFPFALALVLLVLAGRRNPCPYCRQKGTGQHSGANALLEASTGSAATVTNADGKVVKVPKRFTYTPRIYPLDERGFSPADKALAKAFAREEVITDDEEGSLNPYVLKVISAYPLDGSYPYHCGWDPAGQAASRAGEIIRGQWLRGPSKVTNLEPCAHYGLTTDCDVPDRVAIPREFPCARQEPPSGSTLSGNAIICVGGQSCPPHYRGRPEFLTHDDYFARFIDRTLLQRQPKLVCRGLGGDGFCLR